MRIIPPSNEKGVPWKNAPPLPGLLLHFAEERESRRGA
jgi:hypothetical protein